MKTSHTKKSFPNRWKVLLAAGWFFALPTAGHAQSQVQLTHQVSVAVPVLGGDYAAARQQAVSQAFQLALEKALRNFVGDGQFEAKRRGFQKVLDKADLYVQSYRFIGAVDDPIEKKSEVTMEVTLFPDALGQSLNKVEGIKRPKSSKKLVVLIFEKSVTSGESGAFWETTPISETALARNFSEAGMNVVPRSSIKGIVLEETALNAVKGNVKDAVQIGLKAGVDIVILGNARSRKIAAQGESGKFTIQANISVRVVSALNSEVIAAKSDFATARNENPLSGELEAFGDVSGKLSSFLLDSLARYWEAPSASQGFQRVSPSPLLLEDL